MSSCCQAYIWFNPWFNPINEETTHNVNRFPLMLSQEIIDPFAKWWMHTFAHDPFGPFRLFGVSAGYLLFLSGLHIVARKNLSRGSSTAFTISGHFRFLFKAFDISIESKHHTAEKSWIYKSNFYSSLKGFQSCLIRHSVFRCHSRDKKEFSRRTLALLAVKTCAVLFEWWYVFTNLVKGRNQHQIRLSTPIMELLCTRLMSESLWTMKCLPLFSTLHCIHKIELQTILRVFFNRKSMEKMNQKDAWNTSW